MKISFGDNTLSCYPHTIQSKIAAGSILYNIVSRVLRGVVKEGEDFIMKLLDGKLKVKIHCHKQKDIKFALDLKKL